MSGFIQQPNQTLSYSNNEYVSSFLVAKPRAHTGRINVDVCM